jgi:hypothetical protein
MDHVESAYLHGSAWGLACQAIVIAKCNPRRFEMIDTVNEDHSAETINQTTIRPLPRHQKPESRRRRFHNHLVHECECNEVMAFWTGGESTPTQKSCVVDQRVRVDEGIDSTKRNVCAAAECSRFWNTCLRWTGLHFRFQLALPRTISPAQRRG